MIGCYGLKQEWSLQSYWFAVPYDPAAGFGTPTEVKNEDIQFNLATAGSDYAIAWRESSSGVRYKIRSYNGAWGADAIVSDNLTNPSNLRLVVTAGAYTLTWTESAKIYRSALDQQSQQWETDSASYNGGSIVVAATATGALHYAWASDDIYTMRYDGTWSMPSAEVESIGSESFQTVPAMVGAGTDAVIAMNSAQGVYANVFSGAWGEPISVATTDRGIVGRPQLTANSDGYVVSWVEDKADKDQFFVRYRRDGQLSDALSVEVTTQAVTQHQIIADGSAYRIVWSQNMAASTSDPIAARVWVSDRF